MFGQRSWLRRGSARGFGTWPAPACALALLAFGVAAPTAAGASKLAPDPSPVSAEPSPAAATGLRPDSFGPRPAAPVVAPVKTPPVSVEHLPSVVTATKEAVPRQHTTTVRKTEPAVPSRRKSPVTLPVRRPPVVAAVPPVTPVAPLPSEQRAAPQLPVVTTPRRHRHVAVLAPLDLPVFGGRFVTASVLAPAEDFAAADVLRPSYILLAPPTDGRPLLVPAALALLALVLASGSFLGLAFRLRKRGGPAPA